jgi:hypothetical protein
MNWKAVEAREHGFVHSSLSLGGGGQSEPEDPHGIS